MEISTKPSRKRFIRLAGNVDPGQYPHNLQFYSVPPNENVSLAEFEEFAVERLRVLKAVETAGLRGMKGTKEHKEAFTKELNTLKAAGVLKGMTSRYKENQEGITPEQFADRRKDHISHFILRLAYCRSEELRRWFLTQEVDLFRYRFSQESDKSIQIFLKENNLNYTPISDKEKSEIYSDLALASGPNALTDITNFYKVPFTEALDLVSRRKVFIQRGFAYVPQNELIVIILSVFRSRLSQALTMTCRALPQLEEDARLLPMLTSLSKRYLGQDYANRKHRPEGAVTADQVDQVSQESFPLCMQSIHSALRQHHHLKHWGRMQYGLFLKAIGLSLDEAMRFWRAEFSKVMDADKFDKQYAYNIRHNYGKEGKRADYTPYSCVKIITSNPPGPGDHHGCPFKHSDVDSLRLRLQGMGMGKDLLEEIKEDVKGGHYGLACGKVFNFKHNSSIDFNTTHPNEYYETSRNLRDGKISSEGLAGSNATANTKRTHYYGAVSQKSQNSSQSQPEDTMDDNDFTVEDIERMETK